MDTPEWLPELIDVNGEWQTVLATLHRVYQEDFRESKQKVFGLPIFCNTRTEEFAGSQYEATFLHLITRTDHSRGERLVDNRRAERLRWCAAMIDHIDDPEIKSWDYEEGNGDIRTYIWLEAWDYVLILQAREIMYQGNPLDVFYVVTSFYVDGEQNRRKMAGKYDRRVQY
jgi:hypothetical protein